MNKQQFETGKTYSDRLGESYVFLYKSNGVTVFENMDGFRKCRNETGMYRWDGKETELDIGYE